jgi:hypothetical protein
VVKTHIPSAALLFLARFLGGASFLTVREPRDAIASLMQRFHHTFDNALAEVAAGSVRMVALAEDRPFLLRYEDRFFDDPHTVHRVARRLGLKLTDARLAAIHTSLTRDKVHEKIRALTRKGTFGKRPDPDCFDHATHWHPGHVGDGRIGKFVTVLSYGQERAVLAATRDYCAAFAYPERTSPKTRGKPRHR